MKNYELITSVGHEGRDAMVTRINEYAAEGWRVHTFVYQSDPQGEVGSDMWVAFLEKED